MPIDSHLGMDLQSEGGISLHSFPSARRELEALKVERNPYDQGRY